jgi:prophage regulatory protein
LKVQLNPTTGGHMVHPSSVRLVSGQLHHSPVASDVAVLLLRLGAVIRVTGLSRSTLYRLIADGQFPRPVRLGPRAVAWRRVDVEAWSEARPVTSH